MLVDVFSKGITGKVAEAALGKAGITVNKNAIPFDQNPPMVASGIRIGTPAVTTRGMGPAEMDAIGRLILDTLEAEPDERRAAALRDQERQLVAWVAERERAWTAGVDLAAVVGENQRLHGEVERLRELLRRHGIEPDGGTAEAG